MSFNPIGRVDPLASNYAEMGCVDILSSAFEYVNAELESCISEGIYNNTKWQFFINYTNQLKDGLGLYLNKGSFYPALINPMQNGQYEKIAVFFNRIPSSIYDNLQTPFIRLCKAACLLQLYNPEFLTVLQEGDQQHLDSLIDLNPLNALQSLKKEISFLQMRQMNSILETAINKNDLSKYNLAFQCLQEFTPLELQSYAEARSFYPSLVHAMQSGNYEHVIHFLAAFPHNRYPNLITPEIRLCKAACLLQLKSGQFNEAYRECCEKGDLHLLEDKISASFLGSKEAYQRLKEKVLMDQVLFKLADLDWKA